MTRLDLSRPELYIRMFPYGVVRGVSVTNAKLYRETAYAHGTAEWARNRSGLAIGSSEAAAVFPGVSTTVKHTDLLAKFRGEPPKTPGEFLERMFAAGREWEPRLIKEFASRSGAQVYLPKQFQAEELVAGIKQSSTADGMPIWTRPDGRIDVAILEIKWRASSRDDCGWARSPKYPVPRPKADYAAMDELGITVWCQIQHQMWVSGIHVGYVYSGAPSGKRRLWRVDYCPYFIESLFVPQLEACMELVRGGVWRGLREGQAKKQIYALLDQTTQQIDI